MRLNFEHLFYIINLPYLTNCRVALLEEGRQADKQKQNFLPTRGTRILPNGEKAIRGPPGGAAEGADLALTGENSQEVT